MLIVLTFPQEVVISLTRLKVTPTGRLATLTFLEGAWRLGRGAEGRGRAPAPPPL